MICKSETLEYKTERKGSLICKDLAAFCALCPTQDCTLLNIGMLEESNRGIKWIFKIRLFCEFSLPELYLPERLELGLHYEVILAELAAACVWALDPLVEAGLMDKAQGPCAATGCDEGALFIPFAVTDSEEGYRSQYKISQRKLLTRVFLHLLIPGAVINRNCNLKFRAREHFALTLMLELNLWSIRVKHP